MTKVLMMTIQVNLVPNLSEMWRKQLTRIVVIKVFAIAYYHSHFLAATLDFTSFSQQGLHTFFTVGLFLMLIALSYGKYNMRQEAKCCIAKCCIFTKPKNIAL